MATKVQAKTYFPGSMMDLNNGYCNGMWDPYHDDINQGYNSVLTRQTIDGYLGYPKEQMRQTILKQETIFRHQIQELHRLYNRQKDLMNELTMKEHYKFTIPVEAPNSGHSLSQACSRVSREKHTHRRVIDLELPADVEEDNEGKQPVKIVHNLGTKRSYNLADLNEPIQMEEASFAASHINKNNDHIVTEKLLKQDLSTNSSSGFWYLQADPKKAHENLPRKRTIFGVELCESSHKPSFDSSVSSSSWTQNASSLNHNRWIGSSNASIKTREDFAGKKPANNGNSRFMTNGINSKISVSDILQVSHEKHDVLGGGKNNENLEKQLPSWLMKTKGKETTLYQMNLDSLQQHSQQFFKKAEKVQTDNCHGITKILGVPIIKVPDSCKDSVNYSHAENGKNNCILEPRHEIDLNLSFDEEEDPLSTPHIPETVVKSASMNIDLEAPAPLETETDDDLMDADVELVKSAAEAIISIANQPPPHEAPPPADTLLRWFAAVIASGDCVVKDSVNNEECIPQGMDYFEYMTLKLQETKEECHSYKAVIMEEKEEVSLRKRTPRKGQGKRGRQRKDFQRDVLPGIVSLSRREVSEDLQTFEEAFTSIGVSWRSKKKAGGKNGRGRRRLVVSTPSSPTSSPPPSTTAVAVEQSVCREVALEEKSLSGWGKRTRRLPRQRCQNGGNHHSLALKC